MKIIKNIKNKNGFAVAELVVVVSILAVFIVILVTVNIFYTKLALSKDDIIRASFLAEEGIEAVKFVRDGSWTPEISSLTPNQPYYLTWKNGNWEINSLPNTIDKFERKVVFYDVYRDGNDEITDNLAAGVLDQNTKLLEVQVSWFDGNANVTKSMKTYIANIFDN